MELPIASAEALDRATAMIMQAQRPLIMRTGIWKDPVPGRCWAGRLNLAGDGQGDLGGHGGEQRAVFVYQIESYRRYSQACATV